MNRQMKKVTGAAKQWTESFGIPAVVIALWVTAVAVIAIDVASPLPLETAIQKVLATPATQTAATPATETAHVPLPTSNGTAKTHRAS